MARFLKFVVSLILFLSIFPLYSHYKVVAAPIPPGVYLGGVEMSSYKDPAEIDAALKQLYMQPVAVYFDDQRLILRPEDIDFQIDAEAMIQEASQYLEGPAFLDIAIRKLLGLDQKRRDVPLRFQLDVAKLGAWLEQTAETYNRPPAQARVLPPNWNWSNEETQLASLPPDYVGMVRRDWQWTPPRPGLTLDIQQSAQSVVDAFTDPTNRTVQLVLDETLPPPLSLDALSQELDSFLSDFPGFGAVYVQDLTTGEEATVDVDVAFSGMSTLKIAIVSAIFRQLDGPENVDVQIWVDHALGESSNFAANQLIRFLGNGDIFTGARRVTEFMHELGFTNTYLQTGYDDKSPRAEIPTPANQRTDWNTNPDTHLQSTPADMGRLLAEIYRCTQGDGLLLETFGDDFTPEECEYILFYMSHDEFRELIWAGLPKPDSTWIVHKHGFVNEAHSDAALIWGPTGPYVLTVYLFRPGWMDWTTSNGNMKEISRIVWNFFQFKAQQEGIDPPAPPTLVPPPNYVPVNTYRSVASSSWEANQQEAD